jgi:hypothetical protein
MFTERLEALWNFPTSNSNAYSNSNKFLLEVSKNIEIYIHVYNLIWIKNHWNIGKFEIGRNWKIPIPIKSYWKLPRTSLP